MKARTHHHYQAQFVVTADSRHYEIYCAVQISSNDLNLFELSAIARKSLLSQIVRENIETLKTAWNDTPISSFEDN